MGRHAATFERHAQQALVQAQAAVDIARMLEDENKVLRRALGFNPERTP